MVTHISFVVEKDYPFTLVNTENNVWTLYFGENYAGVPPSGFFWWDSEEQKLQESERCTRYGNIVPELFEKCVKVVEEALREYDQRQKKRQQELHPFFAYLEKTRDLLGKEKRISKVQRQILENQMALMEFVGKRRERRKS